MKKVCIRPRKYYNTESQNYVAGQTLEVEDEEAESMEADGTAVIIEDVNQKEEIAE